MEVINGFQCKDCTDVAYAKKHIDPAHPKDGPYGINAPDKASKAAHNPLDPAVKFGGSLNPADAVAAPLAQRTPQPAGDVVDFTA
ncbi:MAG: hypothetical protein JWM33_3404 [Caulobacteraceae bacterium]|nr:hypothetical protein [Caulobacteraceae bacterium]